MSQHFFVVGTDTGIGKTFVTCQLLRAYSNRGSSTIAIKPIVSGDPMDVFCLSEAASVKLPYEIMNPIKLATPVSVHLAAQLERKNILAKSVVAACQPALSVAADFYFIESAGGWFSPISFQETTADLAQAFSYPLILVVGLRLGCLNHALLTYESIQRSGLPLAGWVANPIDPEMLYTEENIFFLKEKIHAPLIEI